MLSDGPVSLGIDYFVSNLEGRRASEIDGEAGGFLKRKMRSVIDENAKGILRGESYDAICYGWMFRI